MRFSEREGLKKAKVDVQIKSMDRALKNGIYNLLDDYIFSAYHKTYVESQGRVEFVFFKDFFIDFLKRRKDELSSYTDIAQFIKSQFNLWVYFQVYDFLEFFVQYDSIFNTKQFIIDCNKLFEKELGGYRFVNKILVPIISNQEIGSIENAINDSFHLNLSSVNTHLTSALDLISDRKSPDYRNSIKESISAVESLCKIISDDRKATLGTALKIIKNKIEIHTALEGSFTKLYGYTSNSDGIRHALTDETTLDQEDALYMLVSCSAFINYLIAKCGKAKINLE